jgi:signal transduction histidine kinase
LRRFRIHDRIAVPFSLVALAATVVAALISLSLFSRAATARSDAQLYRASAVVMRSDFALNPAILELIRDISGADVVTYTAEGTVQATTFDRASHAALLARIISAGHDAVRAGNGLFRIDHDGVPYTIVYRTVPGRPGTTIALVRDRSEDEAGVQNARLRILTVAGATLIVLLVVSRMVARRVSAPIEQLLDFTRHVDPQSTRRAPVASNDEIGRLAAAFNAMLDRLRGSQDALLQSEKLAIAGLLAARVAHDVRNPLSAIKMQTQLLRSRLRGDQDNQAMILAILRDVGQVETVIKGLLELARPGELKLQRARMNDIVEDALVQVMPQLTHNKIAIETSFDPAVPEASIDVERFRLALHNIIINAAEAMPAGGTLNVSTSTDADRSTVVVDVCDDGTGIDPAVADRIFDPFVSTKHDGVGLGLVNTKAVVESHGGRIELLPRSGRGTRARITLPRTA